MTTKAELDVLVKEHITNQGHKIGMGTPACKDWQIAHENCCKGCDFEVGCSKMVAIQLAGFDIDPCGKIDEILAATTADAVRTMKYDMADIDDMDYPDDQIDDDSCLK